jgi:16S rRNA C1402 N4-methylase RsmH
MISKYKSALQLQTGDQSRLQIINSNFTEVLKEQSKFDVLLADLGYSSVHLEEKNGFSWRKNTPLEMVYSKNTVPCSTFVNLC